MGHCEMHTEQLELADELGKVIGRFRAEWRGDHGARADYMKIAIGAVSHALAKQLVNGFREANGFTPSIEHMASMCAEYPPVLINAVAEVLGIRARVVNVDSRMLGEVLDAVLQGRL